MRTRDKRLIDYGVWEEDEKKILAYCKKMDADDRKLLFQSAVSAAPGLEVEIYYSILHADEKMGYRTMIRRGWDIPAGEDDFYGYRRKTLETFYRFLRLYGKWR